MVSVHHDGDANPTLSRNQSGGNSCSSSLPHNIAYWKWIPSSQFLSEYLCTVVESLYQHPTE